MIFVNYAYFYVNTVMSTLETGSEKGFIIFDDLSIYRHGILPITQNIDFARFPAFYVQRVNFAYILCILLTLTVSASFSSDKPDGLF